MHSLNLGKEGILSRFVAFQFQCHRNYMYCDITMKVNVIIIIAKPQKFVINSFLNSTCGNMCAMPYIFIFRIFVLTKLALKVNILLFCGSDSWSKPPHCFPTVPANLKEKRRTLSQYKVLGKDSLEIISIGRTV